MRRVLHQYLTNVRDMLGHVLTCRMDVRHIMFTDDHQHRDLQLTQALIGWRIHRTDIFAKLLLFMFQCHAIHHHCFGTPFRVDLIGSAGRAIEPGAGLVFSQ